MNFTALKQELSDRGFARLSDARLGLLVNEGRRQLDNLYPWPYREASSTGPVPLTIADIQAIEQVLDVNTGNPLSAASYQLVTEETANLALSGTPQWYYITGGTVVNTYPVAAGQIKVSYYKRCPDLTGTNTPLAPSDFHMLYADFAEREAHRVKGDYAAAAAMNPNIADKVSQMVNDLFGMQAATGPEVTPAISDASSDW